MSSPRGGSTVSRRRFLGALGLGFPAAAAAGRGLSPVQSEEGVPGTDTRERLQDLADTPGAPKRIARDEDFWGEVQNAFTIDRSMVNLNNGGVSPTPGHVLAAMKRDLDYANQMPVYKGWEVLDPQQEGVRKRLAREWGVHAEEVALTRNASEGLEILQFGHDLSEGDEVLTTNQDYPRMINTFKQREQRHGITLRQISLPVPAEDDSEVVRRFEEAITPQTKLILMCHMINLTGQILPVKKVVAMAREYDVPVIVDGAHALAHFEFDLADLGCSRYATSLHKWLFAPIGTGLLYVQREEIPDVWPLMAAAPKQKDDIRKFEEIGTHPEANFLAIGEALTFHQRIGGKRKEQRLVYLRDYWAKPLREHDRVRLHTSLKPGYACGIATVNIDGVPPTDLYQWLWDEHRIRTTPIVHEEFQGIRVSPSVYTTLDELDRFVDAMQHVVDNGLPG